MLWTVSPAAGVCSGLLHLPGAGAGAGVAVVQLSRGHITGPPAAVRGGLAAEARVQCGASVPVVVPVQTPEPECTHRINQWLAD